MQNQITLCGWHGPGTLLKNPFFHRHLRVFQTVDFLDLHASWFSWFWVVQLGANWAQCRCCMQCGSGCHAAWRCTASSGAHQQRCKMLSPTATGTTYCMPGNTHKSPWAGETREEDQRDIAERKRHNLTLFLSHLTSDEAFVRPRLK